MCEAKKRLLKMQPFFKWERDARRGVWMKGVLGMAFFLNWL